MPIMDFGDFLKSKSGARPKKFGFWPKKAGGIFLIFYFQNLPGGGGWGEGEFKV